MKQQGSKSRQIWNVALWIIQILLAVTLGWAGSMKLLQPEKAAAMWPWVGQVSPTFLHITAAADILGALGLVLPTLLRIRPWLAPLAALGIVVLMVCALAFHVSRGEANVIGFNILVAALAGVVVWGRWKKIS